MSSSIYEHYMSKGVCLSWRGDCSYIPVKKSGNGYIPASKRLKSLFSDIFCKVGALASTTTGS